MKLRDGIIVTLSSALMLLTGFMLGERNEQEKHAGEFCISVETYAPPSGILDETSKALDDMEGGWQ